MNHLIADNKVATLRAYLIEKLSACFDEREASNIVQRLFQAYHTWSRAEVIMNADQRLGESQLLKYHFALKRLLNGEPLQYILGYSEFMGMRLEVNQNVLIPRPETEELVRLVVKDYADTQASMLDAGTGSGCIAIALKKHIPESRVTAIDVSEAALEMARSNARLNQVSVDFTCLDLLTQVPLGKYSVIVSNPPYIPLSESSLMHERVTQYEPHLALFTSDDDALIFYRRLMELTPQILEPGGSVYCEIHESKSDELLSIASQYSIESPEIHRDMQGKNRMITWKKA